MRHNTVYRFLAPVEQTYMLMIGASAGDLVQYVKNGVRRGREIGGVVNTNATKQVRRETVRRIFFGWHAVVVWSLRESCVRKTFDFELGGKWWVSRSHKRGKIVLLFLRGSHNAGDIQKVCSWLMFVLLFRPFPFFDGKSEYEAAPYLVLSCSICFCMQYLWIRTLMRVQFSHTHNNKAEEQVRS